ncbi:GLPGLI family protein [Maribacter sp. SA7]|uniref:GLPGLI family protein n=1 Tax=Maribacter zhoushanensis TaxID=3030012 RepID=UPI0023ECB325|nr:GLPGLI family protein [Maribacter zhoushanensis]MDF4204738.1 GLPGLI family protein [Maribacter zhoushanensis]
MIKYKWFIAFVIVFMGVSMQAQDFQGKAVYQSKTQVNFDFGNRNIPEDRKKDMMERIKKANEKTFVLTFDKVASIYKVEEKLDQPGTGGGGRGPRFGAMAGNDGDLYKNIQDQQYLIKNELLGKIFLIDDELEALDWKMGSESKKIGNYTAFKATATKTIKRANMSAVFRRPGRGEENKDEAKKEEEFIIKEVEIEAWYTPEIPINQGPGLYWGLPGLILAVNDDVTTIVCSEITMNPSEKMEIKAPTKGKKVTQAEYDEISQEKMKEMRENFRNRGGRGGGRPN